MSSLAKGSTSSSGWVADAEAIDSSSRSRISRTFFFNSYLEDDDLGCSINSCNLWETLRLEEVTKGGAAAEAGDGIRAGTILVGAR
ncbi:hypothetical protein L3X38_027352 [Prunus dulcis]|uniref:Uncharacterized protein n=1 Tax=Prunus dulcis TaxID=3755 RepID=A0AAD4VNN9_PRUDU|nr:hypothetical protein L3X38_027352 [Prunus dulcis]